MEYTITELASHEDLQKTINKLAFEISNDVISKKSTTPPVFICILNGSIHFFSDLVRAIYMDAEIDFMRLKSYEGQDNSAGVKLTKDIELDVTDRHVYLVDDIIDTGATTNYAIDLIKSRNAASVSTVTLFHRNGGPSSTFNGIVIDDEWIYGYGLDDNGLFRNINRVVYKNFKKD